MEKREMICIMCPMGCHLTVTIDGENIDVKGNSCNRGVVFAKEEVTCQSLQDNGGDSKKYDF